MIKLHLICCDDQPCVSLSECCKTTFYIYREEYNHFYITRANLDRTWNDLVANIQITHPDQKKMRERQKGYIDKLAAHVVNILEKYKYCHIDKDGFYVWDHKHKNLITKFGEWVTKLGERIDSWD